MVMRSRTAFLGTVGRFFRNRLVQLEMCHQIPNLRTGQQARVEAVEKKAQLGGLLQFLCGIDGSFQILASHHGTVVGQKNGAVSS
jgi:hypothetical protein